MFRLLLASIGLMLFPLISNAETISVHPADDTFGLLFDEDGISDWDVARNYSGEIYRNPGDSNVENAGMLVVRSDSGVGTYRIYRVSKAFQLDSVPEGAEITGVTLKLFRTAENSRDNTDVVVTSHTREDFAVMQKQDWPISNFGTAEFARERLVADEYTTFEFNQAGIEHVKGNRNALVLGLLTEFDFDNIEPTDYIVSAGWWSSEVEDLTKRPVLEITYTTTDDEREGLYTQIISPHPSTGETTGWANNYFASNSATNTVSYCGSTIADCGCVITSLIMMARGQGIDEAVDGSDVNPGTFNSWLKANDGYDNHGNIFWSRAVDFFGETVGDLIETPFSIKDHKVTVGTDITTAVTADDEYALGFSSRFGHWFLLTDLLEEATTTTYSLLDPFWYNTLTTNDTASATTKTQGYEDMVNRAAVYKYSDAEVATGVIEVTLNSPAELLLVDEAEDRTGYSNEGLVEEIANSGYTRDEFIQNQAELPVEDPHITKRLLATEAAGIYELDVIGTGEGEYDLAISLKTLDGRHVFFPYTGPTSVGQVDIFIVNVDTGEIVQDDVDREQFVAATNATTDGEDEETIRFFERWANKIFDEIESGKNKQAVQHLDTFETLKRAKGVSGKWLDVVTERLHEQLANELE